MDIHHLRAEYSQAGLNEEDLHGDPIQQFTQWFTQAQQAQLPEPNAMSLATVSAHGAPGLRTVLLKYFDPQGFIFFTHYDSAKAKDMAANSQVTLLFPWLALARQVIIHGQAEKTSIAESLRYFRRRPRNSQLGAWASHQSAVLTSRTALLRKLETIKRRFQDGQVPLPPFWGGYRVVPHRMEFWQGRAGRLHDRFLYRLGEPTPTLQETTADASHAHWQIQRLSP